MENINILTENLSMQLGRLIPGVLGAIIVLIVGFFVARMVKKIIEKLLGKTQVDEWFEGKLKTKLKIVNLVSGFTYYIIIIYTLLIVLNLLGVQGVLVPLQQMLSEFMGYLPNFIAAGVITFAGYLVSKIGSEATGFLSERIESFGNKIGIDQKSVSLSKIVKQLVFIVIFIPILIVALDTLKMRAISEPAIEMLNTLLLAVPKIIAAVILLAIFFVVGRYVVSITTELLKNIGLDKLSENIGISTVIGGASISKLIGNVAMFFIMFTGLIAAVGKLELTQVQTILTEIFNASGKIFFGLVVLIGGVYVSNLAVNALNKAKTNNYLVPIARFAILGIFIAFALHTMGIAESIVNLAFGLTLGAIAVAFALSFGLGGREAAGKELEKFFENLRKK